MNGGSRAAGFPGAPGCRPFVFIIDILGFAVRIIGIPASFRMPVEKAPSRATF